MDNSMNLLTNTAKKTSMFYLYTTLCTFTTWFIFNNLEEAFWTISLFLDTVTDSLPYLKKN